MAPLKKSLKNPQSNDDLLERVERLEKAIEKIMEWEVERHPVTGEQRIKKV